MHDLAEHAANFSMSEEEVRLGCNRLSEAKADTYSAVNEKEISPQPRNIYTLGKLKFVDNRISV
jgi:hypothetical protein